MGRRRKMQQHFVEFLSPGTLVSETTTKPISAWNIKQAKEMSKDIKERHGALPYGFRFITRGREDDELDSSIIHRSHMYYLGGTISTLEEVEARNLPDEKTLLSNMKNNDYDRVIENNNSWKITLPLDKEDVILEI